MDTKQEARQRKNRKLLSANLFVFGSSFLFKGRRSGKKMRRTLYVVLSLFAVVLSYSLSQCSFVTTLIYLALSLWGILVWRSRRPKEFFITNYLSQALVALTWALIFFASYVIVRRAQPANYRVEHLAAAWILSAALALYFGSAGILRRNGKS